MRCCVQVSVYFGFGNVYNDSVLGFDGFRMLRTRRRGRKMRIRVKDLRFENPLCVFVFTNKNK